MAIPGNGVVPMSPYDERLATLPLAPKVRPADDGIQPSGAGTALQKSPQQPSAPTLEVADAPTKFKTVDALVRSQDRMTRNDYAIDSHYRRVRAGVAFGRLEKIPNQSIWVAKLPNGMQTEVASAVPNKADDLCNKVEDTLMADPPKAAPKARSEDQTAKQATDLAARWLEMDGGEAGTNDIETYRWALSNSFTGSSSYVHYYVDKTGGGYQPLQKLAHPQATDPNKPLVATIQTPDGPIQENATDPVRRYVNGNQFVEQAAQAERVWLPSIVAERLRREQVRCFPQTATVEKAKAIVLLRHCSLSEAMDSWPDTVGKMTSDQLLALAQWKPSQADYIVPFAFKGSGDGFSGPSVQEVGSLSPILQRRMYSYRLYIAACPEYEGGYQLDVSGANGGTILDETDLEYTVTLPIGGQTTRCKDIPLTQVTPQKDVDGGNPKGFPFIARFAGASEADATLLGAFMDTCDNMQHPHVFIRSGASVDDDDWFDRTVPIILSPSDPEPTYEQFPTLPPILQVSEMLGERMNVISGLTDTAQGLDSSNSVSGTAKNAVIRQAQISMSGFQQNLLAAMARGWRIKCQLAQAEFKVPQMMEAIGEEGSGEIEWWTGEDFAGVDRVGVQPGTGTMMTPESKAQYVAFLQTQQWLAADQAAEVALPGIKIDLGLPEDPFEASIQREIDTFLKGPPPGWMEAFQSYEQQQQTFQAEQAAQVQAQQRQVIQAQQDQAMAPDREKAAQAQALEQQKHLQAIEMERTKSQAALQSKAQDHAAAFNEKQLEAQRSVEEARAKQPPAPVVQPVNLGPIQQQVARLAQMVASQQPKEPDLSPLTAALQQLSQRVDAMAAEQKVIPLAAPKKRGRKKATITGPDGKPFTVEFGE